MGARAFSRNFAPRTQAEVAKALGLTAEQVEYAEASALRKLRAGLKAHGLNAEDFRMLALVLADLSADWLAEGMPADRGAGDKCFDDAPATVAPPFTQPQTRETSEGCFTATPEKAKP